MATKRERILAAVKTALTGTTGVSTRIYRSRVEPMTRAESPAIVVEPIADQPNQNSATYEKLDWTLTFRVVVIVRGNIPDSIADPTIDSLHKKIVADPTLGGLAIDTQVGTTTFEMLDADSPAGVIMCEYRVEYRTSVTDLSV